MLKLTGKIAMILLQSAKESKIYFYINVYSHYMISRTNNITRWTF